MKKHLGSTNESEVIAAEAKICENAGIPVGSTIRWSIINLDLQGIYYIPNPINGWASYSYDQLMVGVTLPEVDIILPTD